MIRYYVRGVFFFSRRFHCHRAACKTSVLAVLVLESSKLMIAKQAQDDFDPSLQNHHRLPHEVCTIYILYLLRRCVVSLTTQPSTYGHANPGRATWLLGAPRRTFGTGMFSGTQSIALELDMAASWLPHCDNWSGGRLVPSVTHPVLFSVDVIVFMYDTIAVTICTLRIVSHEHRPIPLQRYSTKYCRPVPCQGTEFSSYRTNDFPCA